MITSKDKIIVKTIFDLTFIEGFFLLPYNPIDKSKIHLSIIFNIVQFDFAQKVLEEVTEDSDWVQKEYISNEVWFISKFEELSSETYGRALSLLEHYYFDITWGDKVFVFYSKHSLYTWQISLIISVFHILDKVKQLPHIEFKMYFEECIQTQVVANFLISLDAGGIGGNYIGIPECSGVKTLNSHFKEKLFIVENYASKEKSILSFLQIVKNLTLRTNEGKPVRFNALLYPELSTEEKEESISIHNLYMQDKFAENFCQTENSLFKIDENGKIISYGFEFTSNENDFNFLPQLYKCSQKYSSLVEYMRNSVNDNELVYCITLDEKGTIRIYFLTGLVCFYAKGRWHFLHDKLISKALGSISPEPQIIIQTILDSMATHNGCCIGIFPEGSNFFPENDENDFFVKTGIIGKEWHDLSPQNRLEYSSIDGAVLLEGFHYVIRGIGKILPVKESTGGGRSAAAKLIAQEGGVGIKVSEDGYVDVYMKVNGVVENIFSMGK